MAASELELGFDRHRPRELGQERLGEGLVDGHVVPLAPGDRDPRVVVVDLGGAERDVLEPVLRGLGLGGGLGQGIQGPCIYCVLSTYLLLVYLHRHVLRGRAM